MGERYYDPAVGRSTQPDPLDGQTYAYASENPVNAVDPSGLYSETPGALWGPAGGGSFSAPAVGTILRRAVGAAVGVGAYIVYKCYQAIHTVFAKGGDQNVIPGWYKGPRNVPPSEARKHAEAAVSGKYGPDWKQNSEARRWVKKIIKGI